MKATLTLSLMFAVASLAGFTADSQLSASSSSAVIAWGKPVGGLKVGISCDTAVTHLRRLPKMFFYVANDGVKEIPGIIQSGPQCILTVNGHYYAQESFGGKSSWMPPGRKYGPIPIDTEGLRQIPELRAWPTITETAPRPELREGTNIVSLHYRCDKMFVASGEVLIVVK